MGTEALACASIFALLYLYAFPSSVILKSNGTDDGSVYASQPLICVSRRHVYNWTDVDLMGRSALARRPSC